MTIYMIIALLLGVIALAIVAFGSEATGQKVYKAVGAAAMSIIGVAAYQFIAKK